MIAQESWGPVQRRNQLLIKALAVRNPRTRFLFVEQALRPRQAREWRWPDPRRVSSNIWTVRPVRPIPDSVSRTLGDEAECAQIRHAAKQAGLEHPTLWSQDPRIARLIDRLRVDGLLYDLTDDWAAFETEPEQRAQVAAQVELLSRRADLVLACSRWLEGQARAWSSRVRYLPNAVDSPADAIAPADDLLRFPSPRMGYVGTLHSARLDVSLLVCAAEMRPQWTFILVGPDLLEAPDRARLFGLPNVHYLGARPHSEVLSYVTGFDVCLLPNLITDFTRSLDPLKLYEYLAAGRPVVATPAGIPAELSEHIVTVTTAEDVVHAAERVLVEDTSARAESRRASVASATWEGRAAEVERALGVESAIPPSDEVSVVIVNFNTNDLLERCLTALQAQEDVMMQIIVVDNASMDGSTAMLRDRFGDVELVELPENVGFARANNLAFERCRGRYVLVLNSDAFLHRGALRELVAAAERHPSAGAVGPRVLNPDGSLQRSAWPFPRAPRILLEAFALHRPLRRLGLLEDFGVWDHDEERAVDFLIGACLLLRAEALVEVQGFDEGFWLYGEEADLQRRLTARGWAIIFTPAAVATHVGSASSRDNIPRLRHFYAGQKRFLEKHGRRGAWPVARFALVLGSALRRRWSAARVGVELSSTFSDRLNVSDRKKR